MVIEVKMLFRRSRIQFSAITWWLTTIYREIWYPLLLCRYICRQNTAYIIKNLKEQVLLPGMSVNDSVLAHLWLLGYMQKKRFVGNEPRRGAKATERSHGCHTCKEFWLLTSVWGSTGSEEEHCHKVKTFCVMKGKHFSIVWHKETCRRLKSCLLVNDVKELF